MPTLDQIRACFSGDRFATEAAGVTLADFAFAVAANGHSTRVTVTQQVSVTFLSPSRGSVLLAEARCLKAGRTTCLYAVDVTDDKGAQVAHLTVNGYTVEVPPQPRT